MKRIILLIVNSFLTCLCFSQYTPLIAKDTTSGKIVTKTQLENAFNSTTFTIRNARSNGINASDTLFWLRSLNEVVGKRIIAGNGALIITTDSSITLGFDSSKFNLRTYQLNIETALGSTTVSENISIDRVTSTQALTSQQGRSAAIWIPSPTTLTGVRWLNSTQGVYTPSNYNGVALYSYSGGIYTLVASSTNDGTLWSSPAANTVVSKSFSTPYVAQRGVYFVVFLYSSSAQTTAPAVGASTFLSGNPILAYDFTNSARMYWVSTGSYTSLPSTILTSATSATGGINYVAVY